MTTNVHDLKRARGHRPDDGNGAPAPRDQEQRRWRFHGDVEPLDSRPWLVERVLPETGAGLISGQWGTYKTFVALDLAAAVVTGGLFIGFPVRRQGAVLFIACEGESEIAIRFQAALEQQCADAGRVAFAWTTGCPRLLDPAAGAELAAMVKEAGAEITARFGVPVVLVVIDTIGRAAGLQKTGELNDDAVAKKAMGTLDYASRETGALFLGLAHLGKNPELGTKGSTGFEDDADVVLVLLGEKAITGRVENPRLCIRKRRFGSNGDEFHFRTQAVDMGADEFGTKIDTLTIDWLSEAPARAVKARDRWSKSLRLLRQVLENVTLDQGSEQRPYPDGPPVRAVNVEAVRAEFYRSYPVTGDERARSDAQQKAFRRALDGAQSRGLIGARTIDGVGMVWLADHAREHGS